jgi:hypothetical protein
MTLINPDIGVPDGPGLNGGFSPYQSDGVSQYNVLSGT